MKEKLIDILVGHLDEWPFEGGFIIQNADGDCFWIEKGGENIIRGNGFWYIIGSELDREWRLLVNLPLASDWNEAIITEEMWNKAKNLSQSSPPYAVGEIIEYKTPGTSGWM